MLADYCLKLKKKKQTRRFWEKDLFLQRSQMGFYEKTFQEMKNTDPEMFFKTFRMDRSAMADLLAMFEDRLRKTSIRKPILPECRLVTIM